MQDKDEYMNMTHEGDNGSSENSEGNYIKEWEMHNKRNL
jgi:hypothetical protein